MEDSDDKVRAKILRAMLKCESDAAAFRKFRFHRGLAKASTSVHSIKNSTSWLAAHPPVTPDIPDLILADPKQLDPDDQTQWIEITDPVDVDEFFRLCNCRHFGQAETEGTPFTTSPFNKDFDWAASSLAAQQTLECCFSSSPDTAASVRSFLHSCSKSATRNILPAQITLADFNGKMTTWRESTSTSPLSGRHLGHYKVRFSDPDKR